MKKTRIISLLSLAFIHGSPVFSQNFLTQGHQWVYEYNHWSMPHGAYIDQTIETITVEGDFVINDTTYSTVTSTRSGRCGIYQTTEFLREEEARIFRRSYDLSREFLMIDFDETVGYQLIYENGFNTIDTGYAVIDSFGLEYTADGTEVEAQYMHILNNQSFDDDVTYTVYRNIGFVSQGLLFPDLGTGLCDVYNYTLFRCNISALDTIHFTSFGCYESTFIDGTKDQEPVILTLSPNPTSGIVSIPSGLVLKEAMHMDGHLISPYHTESIIYLNELPSGQYIFRFISSDDKEIYVGSLAKL